MSSDDFVFENAYWTLDGAIKKINNKSLKFTGGVNSCYWNISTTKQIYQGTVRTWFRYNSVYSAAEICKIGFCADVSAIPAWNGYMLLLETRNGTQGLAKLYKDGLLIKTGSVIDDLDTATWMQLQINYWNSGTPLVIECQYKLEGGSWTDLFDQVVDPSPINSSDRDLVRLGTGNVGSDCWFDYTEAYLQD